MKLFSIPLSQPLSHSLPASQEAAVLYAIGREADAAGFLRSMLESAEAESNDPELWYMLFDLLRARGEWKPFEALTQRFEARFGVPAPQWLNEEEMARLPAEVRPGGPGYFELAGVLDASRGLELDRVRAAARSLAGAHLDVSRLAALDAEGCAALLELLRFLPQNGNAVVLTGAQHLTDLLRDAAAGNPWVQAYWSLLLELYRLRGQQRDFERTALEFALAAGASPPAWQPVLMPVAPSSQQEKRDEPRYQPGPEVFNLTGVMWGAADPQLTELQAFGAERQYVNINLAQLRRIDFSCGTALANLVNAMAWSSKTVRLIRPNSLVAAFLSTLSLDPSVELVPARRPG
jgi:ABC-type transporter Mla MlaB component